MLCNNFKLIKYKFIIIFFFVFIVNSSELAFIENLYKKYQKNNLVFSHSPNVKFGTHLNGIGYNGDISYTIAINKKTVLLFALLFKIDLNSTYYETYYGIPGRSFIIEPAGIFGFQWGKGSKFGEFISLPNTGGKE